MLDDFLLRIGEIDRDFLIINIDVQNLDIIDVHTVLLEARSRTSRDLASSRFNDWTKNAIAHEVLCTAVEFLNADLLGRRPQLRTQMVSQELCVILNGEPLLGVIALEIDSI